MVSNSGAPNTQHNADTIHRVHNNIESEHVQLLRDYGNSASSRMNVDPVSYSNSIKRVGPGSITRKDNASSECYTANKPLSETASEMAEPKSYLTPHRQFN